MTVVNTDTGEVIDLDRAAAERRAQQIETRLTAVGESFTIAMQKIREAIEHRDDMALGYRSPGEYVSDRFGRALSGLPVEMRREAVRELTEAGLSTRAIAPVVGISKSQVAADRESGVQDWTPDDDYLSDVTTGGEVTPAAPASTGQGAPAGKAPGERVEASPPLPARRPVTGLDGKTYTRPPAAPRATPRRPLPDQFFDAAYDMTRAVERVARLAEDDRFPQNAEKVAAKHRSDLIRARDLLQQVINRLDPES